MLEGVLEVCVYWSYTKGVSEVCVYWLYTDGEVCVYWSCVICLLRQFSHISPELRSWLKGDVSIGNEFGDVGNGFMYDPGGWGW